MRILVTGAGGFIGRNLIAELRNHGYADIDEYDLDSDPAVLDRYADRCDFVFHLAGVNRPEHEEEFMQGNCAAAAGLLSCLARHGNRAPVLMTSSIQAALDNPYGRSKRAGEETLRRYSRETGAPVYLYRLPNVFGKWCRPHYNSVIATFCYQLARGLPIKVNDPTVELQLVYIDDLMDEFLRVLAAPQTVLPADDGFYHPGITHTMRLGDIAETLRSFAASRQTLAVPDMAQPLVKKLYSTYLSYLPEDAFAYPLVTHADARGSFTEFLRTPDRGQVSVNVIKPGIKKGQHWHHTKNEKFLVVSGRGLVRFRRIGSDEVLDYPVSGDHLQVVDIPVGYTHSIENTGDGDMVTVMWANEPFDPDHPDTYPLDV